MTRAREPSASGAGPWTALRLHRDDNVATALRDLAAGERPRLANAEAPVLVEPIPQGHKLSLEPIAAGDTIRKYGHAVGVATRVVAAGAHVHTHNVEGLAGREERGRSRP